MTNTLTLLLLGALLWLAPAPTPAAEAAKPPPEPTLEQRVGDLEAYVNNGTRATDGKAKSNLTGGGPGHNAWMLTSAALVLFMTLPGLALFYGGLVRRKNILSVLAQCLGLAGIVTLLWWACGYSLTFGKGNGWIGGFQHAFLKDVGTEPNTDYGAWVPHSLFMIYQLMFAIITPALTIGAIAERMKFSAIMLFSVLWMFVVYFPVAHWVWGIDGWMNGLWNDKASIKAIDFAGGIVVHMTSGWSALLLCILVGPRQGFGKRSMAPHSMVLCVAGTGFLWAGWYGFNAGSALAADGVAIQAFLTTTLGAAAATLSWALVEKLHRGKPSVLGLCSGAIAGLATITNAAGFVSGASAVLIGALAGLLAYGACSMLKTKFGYDDALDTFGVHGVGGTIGALATALLMDGAANVAGGKLIGHGLLAGQCVAMATCIALSLAATWLLAKIVDRLIGLRPTEEEEAQGLDIADHNEEGYNHG